MRDLRKYLFVVLVSWSTQGLGGIERDWQSMRKQLVEEIIEDTYRTREYLGKSRLSEEVLAAIGKVERGSYLSHFVTALMGITHCRLAMIRQFPSRLLLR